MLNCITQRWSLASILAQWDYSQVHAGTLTREVVGFVLDPTQSEQEQLLVHFIHVSYKCYKSIIKLFYFTTQFLLPTAMSACILCVLQNSIKSDFICIFFFLMVWIIMQSVSIHTPTTKHRKTNASFSMYNYNNIIIFHLLLHCVGLSKTHCFLLNGL